MVLKRADDVNVAAGRETRRPVRVNIICAHTRFVVVAVAKVPVESNQNKLDGRFYCFPPEKRYGSGGLQLASAVNSRRTRAAHATDSK